MGIEGLKNPCENRRSWESMQKLKVSGMRKSMGKIKKGGIKSRAGVKNLKRVKNRHKNHESRAN
jgi:hypothetical protein